MKLAPHDIYCRLVGVALSCALVVIGIEVRHNGQHGPSTEPAVDSASATQRTPEPFSVYVGDIDLSSVPLRSAIRQLARRSRANLDGDWAALRWNYSTGVMEAALSTTQPVIVHRHNPTLRDALHAICGQLQLPNEQIVGIGRDPAGILLLGVAEKNGQQRSVTTLPRFYDVDDLIGPPPRFHSYPRPVSAGYNALLPDACRPELVRLASALNNFAGPGDVGCFGHWLMVNGYEEAHENIAAVLDRVRHPIRLTRAATQVSPVPKRPPVTISELAPVPVFSVPPLGMSGREVLKKWEKVGAGHAVVELSPQDFDDLQDVVGFELHDATLEQIAEQIVGSPFIVVPRGQEDDRVHIRRAPSTEFRLESLPRAYDVSTILAHPDGWIEDARANVGWQEKITSKEDLLIRLVSSHVALMVESRLPSDRQIMSCWNGILLVQEDPEVHVHILEFLEHLQRTGRPEDPAPEQ